ncbi:MAG: FG-GAP repeat domain-containing protein [Verrucomicrobiales bacterium]
MLLLVAGIFAYFFPTGWKKDGGATDELIREVVGSEEVILELTPKLGKLSLGLMNLALPNLDADRELFAETVQVWDLDKRLERESPALGETLESRREFAATDAPRTVLRADLRLWQPLLEGIDFFEHATFKLVRGDFVGEAKDQFESLVHFSGLARANPGDWLGLSADQEVAWRLGEDGEWEIAAWKMEKMVANRMPRLMFSDRLDEALPKEADRQRARHSVHQEELVKYYHSGKKRARSHDFAPIAMNQKPAVSVVDVDGDGFDDLYVMVRMGKNLLLRNRGDGTFEEIAADKELALDGNSTCGLFADFDNDGDPDLMLGRSVERFQYFENTGVWFSEIKDPWAQGLPSLAVSMSAADFNGDGLLDVYICTYRPEALGDSNPGLMGGGGSGNTGLMWPDRFLPAAEAAEYHRRHRDTDHHFLDQIGPPNSLWINRGGGKFERSPLVNEQVEIWENSLQATWSDIDEDGDPDLYVANDFAQDCMFRNDGEAGFVDIAGSVGLDVYGFGMGASFGDYDGDGLQDLYVSNMFSKAGRRILSQFQGIGGDYVKSTQGNVLYQRSADGRFAQVSGLEKPALKVAKAGWSWGGQFADFDNDCDLDLYALSGYFTAPQEVASEIDL